jgi:hypothetical protein
VVSKGEPKVVLGIEGVAAMTNPKREAVKFCPQCQSIADQHFGLVAENDSLSAQLDEALSSVKTLSRYAMDAAEAITSRETRIAELEAKCAAMDRAKQEVGQRYADMASDLAVIGDLVLFNNTRGEPVGEYAKKVHAAIAREKEGK